MALIKCIECQKEISDTVKVCPHCGYKLKKENKLKSLKIDIYNIRTISCFLLILSFITSFFKISFSKDYHDTSGRFLVNRSFNATMWDFVGTDKVYIIIGIISIVALIYYIVRKKVKFKIIVYYIPAFIYNLLAIILIRVVLFDGLDSHGIGFDVITEVLWGGIWILIMLCASSVFLIIDLVKNKKKERK